jgi:ribosomal protein RSM22 (predicted rRNA methylase)
MLPENLKAGIEAEISNLSLRELGETHADLSKRYRKGDRSIEKQYVSSQQHRQAYLSARLPATFAAVYRVLQEIQRVIPALSIRSLLDLGAGPGTAMWAAGSLFSDLESVTLIEQDPAFIAMGKRLASHALSHALQAASWQQKDLQQVCELSAHDLVIFSYSIGELKENMFSSIIDQAWQQVRQVLVIIEPGTPQGFRRIRASREQLIKNGAHLIAPCPHADRCPIQDPDWCHFSQRLERSSTHRKIKQGSMSHEDEKFSYIAVSKIAFSLPQSRIIRHPQRHTGHVDLRLCTDNGKIETVTFSRKDELYRSVCKADWGDPLF